MITEGCLASPERQDSARRRAALSSPPLVQLLCFGHTSSQPCGHEVVYALCIHITTGKRSSRPSASAGPLAFSGTLSAPLSRGLWAEEEAFEKLGRFVG